MQSLGNWFSSTELEKGIILPFYKGIGSRRKCSNYRGITILCPWQGLCTRPSFEPPPEVMPQRREWIQPPPVYHWSDCYTEDDLILQTRREHGKPSWVAYVDFRAAFDSVDRPSMWLLLESKGIPWKLIELLEDLYSNTISCVRADGLMSEWFPVSTGIPIREGCVVAPDMFLGQSIGLTVVPHTVVSLV